MVSDRARQQWGAFLEVRGGETALSRERDELHRSLVGLQLRGEPLSAAHLGALLDEADVDGDARREQLGERIGWGLALLDAYENQGPPRRGRLRRGRSLRRIRDLSRW